VESNYALQHNPVDWEVPQPLNRREIIMRRRGSLYFILLLTAVFLGSCAGSQPSVTVSRQETGSVEFIILQMNDIYELTPVSGGNEGGLARVAALRKELLADNQNTITVLAGDLFSPSALGTAKVDGHRLAGRQIVAVMNTLGLDYITFGNHEFDLREQEFLNRLAESKFTWISSNVFDRQGKPFPGVESDKIIELRDGQGRMVRLGLFGLTVPTNVKDYVSYTDPLDAARASVRAMRDKVDVLVALTHLSVDGDTTLASTVSGIDLILGGHEHENMQFWRGGDFVPIFKADANARTVYIHRVAVNPDTGRITVRSELRRVTDQITADPVTETAVAYWQDLGFKAFRQEGFEPEKVVVKIPTELDGLETSVRNRATLLTELIAQAMLAAVPAAELALYNSGSIRIDDVLPPGPLSQYDIIRILPFGGRVCEASVEGRMLRQVLDQGETNSGNGGFLQTANVTRDAQQGWLIRNQLLDDNHLYTVATNDFLLSGREQNLGFFSMAAPGVHATCAEDSDIRFVFKDYLVGKYPQP